VITEPKGKGVTTVEMKGERKELIVDSPSWCTWHAMGNAFTRNQDGIFAETIKCDDFASDASLIRQWHTAE